MNMDPERGNASLRVLELHDLDPRAAADVLGKQQAAEVRIWWPCGHRAGRAELCSCTRTEISTTRFSIVLHRNREQVQ